MSIEAVILITLGFFILRGRRKRKEAETMAEKNHVGTEKIIGLGEPSVPQELLGYQEWELSTGARNLRPELSASG